MMLSFLNRTLVCFSALLILTACTYPGMDRTQAKLGQDVKTIADQQTLHSDAPEKNAGVIYPGSAEPNAQVVRETYKPKPVAQAPVTINIGK